MARTAKSTSDQTALEAPPPEETKVFLSYSRRDAATLQRIADALISHPEFQPDFDKAEHDPDKVSAGISADEPWWQRLEQMIAGAEAMVFLVSPHSAASKVCDEEIAYAQRVGKRIIPVLSDTIDFAKLPPKLSALNIAIDFTEAGPGFDEAMSHLVRALSVNAAWLREGRRYTERAAEWERKGRPKGGLLPTGAFEEAEAWAARRPKNEPEPGELFTAWIAASRANIQEQLARERRQIRRARIWQGAAALILVGGFAALAYAGWFLVSEQRAFAKSKSLMLARTAERFAEAGDHRRALVLSILASRESALSPATLEAWEIYSSSVRSMKQALALSHESIVFGAAFSNDETRILTWSGDNTARIWDADTGAQIGSGLQHNGFMSGAAFSQDDSRILTWSGDGTARIWNADTGVQNGPTFQHKRAISRAVFSNNESRVLTSSWDHTAQVWNAGTGARIGPAFQHRLALYGAAFSKDETRILTWSADSTARIWDVATGAQIGPAFQHKDHVLGAAFSKDETRILTWSKDGTARLWDSATGAQIGPALQYESAVSGAIFSKDETRILTWSNDNTGKLWEAGTGTLLGPAFQHRDAVLGAIFSNNDARILSWSEDGTARLWSSATGAQIGPALQNESVVVGAAFSKDETRILTWSYDGTARIWDMQQAMTVTPQEKDVVKVCDVKLRGSLAPDDQGGFAPLPRLIDATIIEAAPILNDRKGENVCNTPQLPWWNAPLLKVIEWTGME